MSKGKNRHIEFIRNIYVNVPENIEAGETENMEENITTTLDGLLKYICDEEG